MRVQAILSSKPTTDLFYLSAEAQVSEAVRFLSERRVGAVVVSPDGAQPAGILSERDIVREMGKRGAACLEDSVGQMMTPNPVTCGPDEDAVQILERMTNGRFRHMPVVEGGKMVGIISIGDVVKARLAELQSERDALEGMIAGH